MKSIVHGVFRIIVLNEMSFEILTSPRFNYIANDIKELKAAAEVPFLSWVAFKAFAFIL